MVLQDAMVFTLIRAEVPASLDVVGVKRVEVFQREPNIVSPLASCRAHAAQSDVVTGR